MRYLILVGMVVLAGCCGSRLVAIAAPPTVVAPQDKDFITAEFREESIRTVLAWIAERSGHTVILDVGIEDRINVHFHRLPWLQAVEEAADRARCVMRQVGDRVIVEKPARVTMEFKRADLIEVIRLLAEQSGANITIDPGVKGEVTMRFSDVPWMRALHAVVKSAGYVLIEKDRGRILRVADPAKLVSQMETWILYFHHLRPTDVWKPKATTYHIGGPPRTNAAPRTFTLLDVLRNLLTRQPGPRSEGSLGRLDYDEAANAIVVTDLQPVIDQLRGIIEALDVPAQK